MDRYLIFSISNSVTQFLELAYLKQPNVNVMAFLFPQENIAIYHPQPQESGLSTN